MNLIYRPITPKIQPNSQTAYATTTVHLCDTGAQSSPSAELKKNTLVWGVSLSKHLQIRSTIHYWIQRRVWLSIIDVWWWCAN